MKINWKVKIKIQIPCPEVRTNPYNGESSNIGCAVYHFREEIKEMTKEFKDEKEADQFIKNAPNDCYDFIKI